VPSADSGSAVTFDLEVAKGAPAPAAGSPAPPPFCIQFAFQYSRVVPAAGGGGAGGGPSSSSLQALAAAGGASPAGKGGGGGGGAQRFELQRRLRVATFR
jgi:hypothetical protein